METPDDTNVLPGLQNTSDTIESTYFKKRGPYL